MAGKPTKAAQETDRVPATKSAAMRYILEQVENGYRYYTQGVCPMEKAEKLAQKFAEKYGTNMTKGQRDYARTQERARCVLVMFPDNHELGKSTHMQWWLLATKGVGEVWKDEDLKDSWKQRLTWDRQYPEDPRFTPQYVLSFKQIPSERGGGWGWTWVMSKQQKAQLSDGMAKLCHRAISASSDNPKAAKSTSKAKADRESKHESEEQKLRKFIATCRTLPGFRGIRDDLRQVFQVGRKLSGSLPQDINWNDIGIWIDKALPVFKEGRTLPAVVQEWRDLRAGSPQKEAKPAVAQGLEDYWKEIDDL